MFVLVLCVVVRVGGCLCEVYVAMRGANGCLGLVLWLLCESLVCCLCCDVRFAVDGVAVCLFHKICDWSLKCWLLLFWLCVLRVALSIFIV